MKNIKHIIVAIVATILIATGCNNQQKAKFIKENVEFATAQTELMLQAVGEPTGRNYPRSIRNDGTTSTTSMYDWTPGFFPGTLWYLYELTGDNKWKEQAEKWTESLEPLKTFTRHHDLGFMMYCSYGNAERLASKPHYKDILVESASSLSTRFYEIPQSIKSWEFRRAWNDTNLWQFPVIIDNMMNLEMLFYASKVTGNSRYYDLSVTHANTSLKNHFREDFSTYHVVDYDTVTGEVRGKETAQGFSDNSTWSRGQAWAIYGFTMTYRETKDKNYLNAAIKATDFFLKNLPEDLIPHWDFNIGEEGYTPRERSHASQFQEKLRDASAAAIVCSALFELSKLANNSKYYDYAVKMLHSLASPAYRAQLGENANFIIMHCVGSIPHGGEIDVPLVYADYYFLEALVRYKRIKN
ncbi:MAG: glycoside hydrolase family 88 protein [Bacteroidales bacterium]|nr:glycoside hydrolase family 88 protein [Bacteroidales bacterium]